MHKIFISYRREDAHHAVDSIYERLRKDFDVVYDDDAFLPGANLPELIDEKVRECDALLVIIGDRWLSCFADGQRTRDFVRAEILAAMSQNIPIVPVLISPAKMPDQDALPPELKALADRIAQEVRAGSAKPFDLDRLVRGIRELLTPAKVIDSPVPPVPPPPEPPIVEYKLIVKNNSFGMPLVRIVPSKNPAMKAEIKEPFWLAAYEITNGHYRKVMGDKPGKFKDNEGPIECVSWNDAVDFCDRLSTLDGAKFIYRLPTQAEWEYACRAGHTTAYSFGDDESQLGQYAWFNQNSGGQTHPVGKKMPNDWGLYDMHGNVWEWCEDSRGSKRVIRGGCWMVDAFVCRAATRNWREPGHRHESIGFRVAAD